METILQTIVLHLHPSKSSKREGEPEPDRLAFEPTAGTGMEEAIALANDGKMRGNELVQAGDPQQALLSYQAALDQLQASVAAADSVEEAQKRCFLKSCCTTLLCCACLESCCKLLDPPRATVEISHLSAVMSFDRSTASSHHWSLAVFHQWRLLYCSIWQP